MVTEKEAFDKILRSRGIIDANGVFSKTRFQKLVTEPWIHQKAKAYGLLDNEPKVVIEIPVEPKAIEVKTEEKLVEQEVNLTELPAEEVKVKHMEKEAFGEIPAEEPIEEKVEEPTQEEEQTEEEKVEEQVEEPIVPEAVEIPVEEAHTEEPVPQEEPVVEVATEEVPAKKSVKKGKK